MKHHLIVLMLLLMASMPLAAQKFTCTVPRVEAELLEVKLDGNDLIVRFRLNPRVNSTLFSVGSARYLLDPLHKWKRAQIGGTGGRRGVDATSNYVNHGDYYFVRVVVKDLADKGMVHSVEAEIKTQYGTGTVTLGYTTWDKSGKMCFSGSNTTQQQSTGVTQQSQPTVAPAGQLPTDFVANDDFLSRWVGMKFQVIPNSYEREPRLGQHQLTFGSFKKIAINDYETDYLYSDGMLAVYNKDVGKWGFYDEDGNLLKGGFRWTKNILMSGNYRFSSGHCLVMEVVRPAGSGFRQNVWYLLDKQGNATVLPFLKNASSATPFNNGGIAAVEIGGMYNALVLVNTKGQRVFQNLNIIGDTDYDHPLGDFIDGWARVRMKGGVTYINPSGQTIGRTFWQAQPFSDGLAAVQLETDMGKRWGFINTSGQLVIPARFTNEPSPFSYGYAVVKKQNEKMVFINRQGEVCSPEADAYTNFVNGYAFAMEWVGNKRVAWIVDRQLQRHDFPNDLNHISGEDVDYLARRLPVKTVFDGRYIPSIYLYGDWNTDVLYHPQTGYKIEMGLYGREVGPVTTRRTHVKFDPWHTNRHFFINEKGQIVLEFVKEEF